MSPPEALLQLLRSLSRGSPAPTVLAVDGLEKTPAEVAHAVLEDLVRVASDSRTQLLSVLPLELSFGERYSLLPSLRLVDLLPIPTWPDHTEESEHGRSFLRAVARERLGPDDGALDEILWHAAMWSGGIPRTFLQLLQDAAARAILREAAAPEDGDAYAAVHDHEDSMRRLLKRGDAPLIHSAHGTDGHSLPDPIRVRMLSQGLMIESRTPEGPRLRCHPLLLREVDSAWSLRFVEAMMASVVEFQDVS